MSLEILTKPIRLGRQSVPTLRFLCRNLWCARRLTPFPTVVEGSVILGPLYQNRMAEMEDLYARVTNGRNLGRAHRWLLQLVGPRLCLLASDNDSGQVVGLVLYYFNSRDGLGRTIHEGFTGVAREWRRRGIGTALRRTALAHYARSGLTGVSSRVSVSNVASLKSNSRLGFVPIDRYFDPGMGEERYYLVCRFDRSPNSQDGPAGNAESAG